jgi:hypothetical protein
MSRKEQLIVAEGISKKNILPQFGKNNEANTKTEDTFRKFMYEKKPITEATLTENPLMALGAVLGRGAGAALGGEAAGAAAGVTKPVMKGVGQAAMDLAAKGGENEPSDNQEIADTSGTGANESIVKAFLNDLNETMNKN